MRPHTLHEVVERTRRDPDWNHHLSEFLDAFYGADGDTIRQAGFIGDEPGLLGDRQADAFVGGVGEHLARRWNLPIPAWVRHRDRYLTTALFVPDERPLRGYLLCVSPVAFRARLIFTGPDPLQRARFPYHRGVIAMPSTYPPI
ncbi:hypothetical protein [Methylobacterium trifolii]|uniref:Uncharacterized protein n=1 Tax=Methylobacterium trifolii TaxID=1003092 RepID=A0ABQ4TUD0_9HYPH|nr:hypothetical protein [Methylobacterium trifolii]GJE58888.1 hypothetical protein MPOCJGCO_0973 [Methylobacterium trifolii]